MKWWLRKLCLMARLVHLNQCSNEFQHWKLNFHSPILIYSHINKLAPILGHIFKGLQVLTGWSFSVLMGGPNPESGGRIEACSIHVGSMELGHTFNQVYLEFNSAIMQPYRSFLDKVVGKFFNER